MTETETETCPEPACSGGTLYYVESEHHQMCSGDCSEWGCPVPMYVEEQCPWEGHRA